MLLDSGYECVNSGIIVFLLGLSNPIDPVELQKGGSPCGTGRLQVM
jgi:hypothetical protein